MSEAWIGVVIGGIIGIIATSVGATINGYFNRSTTLIQLHSQKLLEEERVRYSKLEELHELLSRYIMSCNNYSTNLMEMLSREPSIARYIEITNFLMEPMPRISSLVGIYVPELNEKWSALTKQIAELNGVGGEYFKGHRQNVDLLLQKSGDVGLEVRKLMLDLEKILHEEKMSKAVSVPARQPLSL